MTEISINAAQAAIAANNGVLGHIEGDMEIQIYHTLASLAVLARSHNIDFVTLATEVDKDLTASVAQR